jgi:hypothetical protein
LELFFFDMWCLCFAGAFVSEELDVAAPESLPCANAGTALTVRPTSRVEAANATMDFLTEISL